MKKINLYYGIDFIAVAIICIAFYKKVNYEYAYILLVILVVLLLIAKNQSATVINKSKFVIFGKHEDNDSELVEIKPGETVSNIDGVKVEGRVFKAVNGTHITIKADGRIKTHSITGRILNKIRGGYLDNAPDSDWDWLFNA